MEAGFSRMNSVTVIQTSQGLAHYLLDTIPGAAQAGIVVGYDARHNSRRFAELAAAAFVAKGIKVWWYEDLVHTPMVPFAVTQKHAAGGVMITASHNPAQDNGYKVYGNNGCQINSPADVMIAASILENLEPVTWDATIVRDNKLLVNHILIPVMKAYFSSVVDLVGDSMTAITRFVYTPMHGVGLRYMTEALQQVVVTKTHAREESVVGKKDLDNNVSDIMTVVQEQAMPDPDFPTVRFPNPEEEGALDRAITMAESRGIRLILANDPDADRFAVAEKVDDLWHQFTGDQVGVLLGYYVFQAEARNEKCTMLTSTVSSQMLAHIAEHEGFSVEECLTGFKWLGNRAKQLGSEACFGYEEALGYMIPKVVHDKDGVTAAILFLMACCKWGSPWQMLQSLYKKYGYFVTMNTYWRSPDVTTTTSIFQKIRNFTSPHPEDVGGRKVVRWRDLTTGYDSATKGNVPTLPSSRTTQMITCWLSGSVLDEGLRFTIRASGTEPKIKSKGQAAVRVLQC